MKRALQLIIILFLATSARATATFTTPVPVAGCVANAAATCTPANLSGKTAVTGDLVVSFFFRTATTAPSAPLYNSIAMTSVDTATASTSSFRSACAVLTSGTLAATSATNATRVVSVIFHNAYQGATATANCAAALHSFSTSGSSGTTGTYSFAGGTLSNTNGSSLVIGFVGSSAAPCLASTLTQNTTLSSTDILYGDTGTGVSTFVTGTCAGTAGNWKTDTLEVLPFVAYTPTVTKIGSSAFGTTTCVVTASSGVALHHGVLFALWGTGTTNLIASVTDSASNTYNKTDGFIDDTSDNVFLNFGSAYMGTAIASSGTITITATGGSCLAYDVSTLASASWLDKAATNDNAFAALQSTGTTASTANSPNVNISYFTGAAAAPVLWTFPWIPLDTITIGSRTIYTEWEEVTTTGAQSGSITIPAGDNTAAGIGSYKNFVAPGGASCNTMIGVGCI